MRIHAVLAAALTLAACHHGPSNDAIRQAVLDRLRQPGMGLNMDAMDVSITSVQVNGTEADATVQLSLKDAKNMPGMTVQYHLRQEGSRWLVTGLTGSSAGPHGAGAPPPAADNPHGQMPSPGDLPPAGKGR